MTPEMVDTITLGVAGVVSATTAAMPAVATADPMVQVVSIVCSMVVAVANISFGYLIYKSKREK